MLMHRLQLVVVHVCLPPTSRLLQACPTHQSSCCVSDLLHSLTSPTQSVTQSISHLLTHPARPSLPCLQITGHPRSHHPPAGVSNDFLAKTASEWALTYNDLSVNENYHASRGWRILLQAGHNFLDHLDKDSCGFLRSMIVELVLATDMKVRQESWCACHAYTSGLCVAEEQGEAGVCILWAYGDKFVFVCSGLGTATVGM